MAAARSGLWERARGALRLLWLFLSPRRDRPERIYGLLGTENNLGDKTRFLNLGYWERAEHYDEACAALARLLAERVGLDEGQEALDCGCGLGDQDALWMDERRPARLVAINVVASQLEVARRAHAREGLEYVEASATELPFEAERFDRVLALESSFHFDTRERFLHEAFRVLRPGGRLGIADALPRGGEETLRERVVGYFGRGMWQAPAANLYGAERLVELLEEAGFVDVDLLDITEHVYRPFKAFARRRIEDPEVAARLNPLLRRIYAMEHGGHDKLQYVVVTANKPADDHSSA